MTKDILITLLNALQIELGLLLLFFLVLVLGLRSRLSKSTQSRILIGLISTIVITFLAFVVLAYRNDMIDTSNQRGQAQLIGYEHE